MVRETILSCYNLIHKKKAGRPPLYERDLGTPEIQEKRHGKVYFQELNFHGTIAGYLIKEDKIVLEEVEIFQKIYLLRKKFLSLQRMSETCHSSFLNLGMPGVQGAYFKSIEEDEILEQQWRTLAHYLCIQDKNILTCISKLFSVHSYESLQDHYDRFITEFSGERLRDFAYYSWSAWKAIKKRHG